MKFNEYGYLDPGFHDLKINDIRDKLVESFENSSTRKDILDGYIDYIKALANCGVENIECWIDGSFSTDKTNPNDIDMIIIVDKDDLDNIAEDKKNIVCELFNPHRSKIKYKCDAYILPKVDEQHSDYNNYISYRSYWRGFFGFDRKEIPKGIIRMNIVREVDKYEIR